MEKRSLLGTAVPAFLITAVPAAICDAATIDRFFTIQPIQVCDDAGSNCASAPLSKTWTETVYEQAGVAPIYLPTNQINNSSLLSVDGVADVNKPGNGQSSNVLTLNTWFVDSLNAPPNSVLYGEAYLGGNGAVINSSAVDAATRSDTVAHELGHNLGLGHNSFGAGGPDNVMTSGASRNAPADDLTQAQIDQIRSSQFVQAVPTVTVDLRGATPFETTDFFDISFDDGPTGVSLTKLTVDLSPVGAFFDPTNSPPGTAGSAFGFGRLSGVAAADFTVSGMFDGSQLLSLDIAPGAFMPGESFAFGSDVDLLTAIDAFGATPEELVGAIFGFEFDIGLALSTVLDADLVTSSLEISQISQFLGDPRPFGPQLEPGQLPPIGPIIEEPFEPVQPIPIPATYWLLLAALVSLKWCGRRRRLA